MALSRDNPDDEHARFIRSARQSDVLALVEHITFDAPRLRPRYPPPGIDLIGRTPERATLAERLRAGDQRLVTLVGPGGIGKTSLALQVAADLSTDPAFPDGIAVALLAPITGAGDVPRVVAEALGLALHGARPAIEQLIDALRDSALLLVLDNAEHLLGSEDSPLFSTLLLRLRAEVPRLRILVTSRERLQLRSEWVMRLGGLVLPPSGHTAQTEQAAAVQLFIERARRVGALTHPNSEDWAAVARICQRLEGLPLAIELAAGWTHALRPAEIAAELDRSLDFLTTSERDVPERHRSLRAALDHSWQLLDERERQILARLVVFSGSSDRAAAQEVAGAGLASITALIDKSLVQPIATGDGTRYTLHELVRQYAAEQLAVDPQNQQATQARHSRYYAHLLQRSIEQQTGGASPESWAGLVRDIDNLRVAWMRAAASGDTTTVMEMARGLALLYDTQGWLSDGARLFEREAETFRRAAPEALAAQGLLIGWQGYFLYRSGQLAEATRLMEHGVALSQAAGSTEGLANLLLHLGAAELYAARFAQMQAHHTQALRLAETAGDQFTRHWLRFFQGQLAMFTGSYAAAEQHFAACLAAWRSQAFSRGIVAALLMIGEAVRLSGRAHEAEDYIRESLHISSATRDHSTIAACLRELGALALARNELDVARYLLTESYENLHMLGDSLYAGRSRSLLARLEVQHGDLGAARQGCGELLQLVHEGMALLLPEAAYGLALVLAAEGDAAAAHAVLTTLDGAPGEYATLQLAAQLRNELEQRHDHGRNSSAIPTGARALLPWLESLAAHPAAGAQPAGAVAAPDPLLSGAFAIPETGEILSPREVEVLRLLIAGKGNQAIADSLMISLYTAKNHVANILRKLGVATRTQAALHGRALGLAPLMPD